MAKDFLLILMQKNEFVFFTLSSPQIQNFSSTPNLDLYLFCKVRKKSPELEQFELRLCFEMEEIFVNML